jgi:hypothetical protein
MSNTGNEEPEFPAERDTPRTGDETVPPRCDGLRLSARNHKFAVLERQFAIVVNPPG